MNSQSLSTQLAGKTPCSLRLGALLLLFVASVVLSGSHPLLAESNPALEAQARQSAKQADAQLRRAAKRGDLVAVQALLDSGANPNAPDEDGDTALHWAFLATHASSGVEVARALIEAGADPSVRGSLDATPLQRAAKRGDRGGFRLLMDLGADPSIRDEDGDPPLHWAFLGDHAFASEFTLALLEAGADPNARGSLRATPLHHAAKDGLGQAVELLVAAGADLHAEDKDGDTPLHWAFVGDVEFAPAVLGKLLEAGADPNARGSLGATPLHRAAKQGDLQAIEMLVARGADLRAEDQDGDTPLYWAAWGKQVLAARTLASAESAASATALTAMDLVGRHGDLRLLDVLLDVGLDRALPRFEFPDADGRQFTSADIEGQVVLLNLWATWCGPCRSEMPWFVEFQSKYQEQGFTVVAISVDDDGWDAVTPFVEEFQLNFPVLLGGDAADAVFGTVDAIPATLIIDRSGNVAFWHQGVPERSEYEGQIESWR